MDRVTDRVRGGAEVVCKCSKREVPPPYVGGDSVGGGAMGTSRPTLLGFGFADLEADEAPDRYFVAEFFADARDVVAH
jgi:hypothetical protein